MCRRRLKIKKLIFSTALLISFLLFTCEQFAPDDDFFYGGGDSSRDVNNDYSLTVYLDGYTPVSSSRALAKESAVLGHDLFEVAFYHPASGTAARAAWERGHAAGVSGVVRNIDYRYVSEAAAIANTGGATNPGAAILFVGKRSDKTLLAVGRLVGVNNDDGLGTVSSTLVTADTISVTFMVSALKAGASRSLNKSASSFITGGAGGYTTPTLARTEIVEVYIGSRIMPLYRLDRNQSTYAEYRLDVTTGDFDSFYGAGIRRGGPAALIPNDTLVYPQYGAGFRLQPRYPRGDGTYALPSSFTPDINTAITLRNNTSAGPAALANPVQFTFNTNGTADSVIFSFAFEIPVFPLTNADSRGNANWWYIRPGYDSYLRDVDDGIGGTGGAVLIGVGSIDQSLVFSFTVGSPFKTRYYRTTSDLDPAPPGNQAPPASGDFVFDLDGLQIAIRAGGVPIKGIPVNSATYILGGTGGVTVLPGQDLFPIIFLTDAGGSIVYDSDGKIQIRSSFAGFINNMMITVRVEYFDPDTQALGDDPYYGFFSIYLSDPGSMGPIPPEASIPPGNRWVIRNFIDLYNFQDAIQDDTPRVSDTFIVVFYDSFDLRGINLNGGPYLIIVLAAEPNIVLGKETGGGFINWSNNTNTFYYGIWPYNDAELIIFGQAVTSQPFRINAAGSYTTINSGVRTYPAQWFNANTNYTFGASSIVNVGSGVDIVHSQNFTQVNTANPP